MKAIKAATVSNPEYKEINFICLHQMDEEKAHVINELVQCWSKDLDYDTTSSIIAELGYVISPRIWRALFELFECQMVEDFASSPLHRERIREAYATPTDWGK